MKIVFFSLTLTSCDWAHVSITWSACCSLKFAVVMYSSLNHNARLSAVLGHLMQDVTNEDEEQSWGQHSTLWDALPEDPLFGQVFFLDFCFPVVHVLSSPFVHLPSNTTLAQFQFQTFFPHLVKCLFHVNPYCKCVLLVLEVIVNSLRVGVDLVLSRPFLPKCCLLWCDVVFFCFFVFKVPHKSCVFEVFIRFPAQLVWLIGRKL